MFYTNRIISRLLISLMLLIPLSVIADDGKAIFVIGKVQVQNANGDKFYIKRGSEINSGDIIITSSKGQAQIKMADGTLLAIRPDSQFKISDYQYKHNVDTDKSVYSLVKGGFRSITGKMGKAKKSSYAVKTVVGTIGIRGTDFSARLCDNNCTNQDNGLYVGVMQGGVVLTNDGGQLNVSPGDFGFMPDAAIQPSYLDSMPGDLLFSKSKQSTVNMASNDAGSLQGASNNSTTNSLAINEVAVTLPIETSNKNGNLIELTTLPIDAFTALLKDESIAALTPTTPVDTIAVDTTPVDTIAVDTTPVDTTPTEPTIVLPMSGSANYITTAYTQDTGTLDTTATSLTVDFTTTDVTASIVANVNSVETWSADSNSMKYDTTGNFIGTMALNITSTEFGAPPTRVGSGTSTLSGALGTTAESSIGAPSTATVDYVLNDATTVNGHIDMGVSTTYP